MTWNLRDHGLWKPSTAGVPGATTGRALFTPGGGSATSALATGTYFAWDNPQTYVEAYESWLGRPLDYLLIFTDAKAMDTQTADPYDHLALPSYIRARHEQNPHLGLWMGKSMVMRQKDGSTTGDWGREMSWTDLANGAMDLTWQLQGQRVQALQDTSATRPPPRLRGAHEVDLSIWYYYPQDDIDVAAYKDACQRYYDIVKAECPSAIIEFNPVSSAGIGGHRTYASLVPPSTAFDALAVDTYDMAYNDWGWVPGVDAPPDDAMREAMWQKFVGDPANNRGLAYLRAQAVALGKPLSFPEVGTGMYQFKKDNVTGHTNLNTSGGDNPFYVNGLADFIFDPAYPAGTGGPGCVDAFAWWEDGAQSGSMNGLIPRDILRPTSFTSADDGRKVSWSESGVSKSYSFSMTRSRDAFVQRFITDMNGAA